MGISGQSFVCVHFLEFNGTINLKDKGIVKEMRDISISTTQGESKIEFYLFR